jgi:hypothetical protein
MIKNIKTTNFGYENKTFQKSKYIPLIFHYNSMFYNDIMVLISSSSPKIFFNKSNPMFYSNGDKNYVI